MSEPKPPVVDPTTQSKINSAPDPVDEDAEVALGQAIESTLDTMDQELAGLEAALGGEFTTSLAAETSVSTPSEPSELESDTADLASQGSDLASEISDSGSETANPDSEVLNLDAQLANLKSQISDLNSEAIIAGENPPAASDDLDVDAAADADMTADIDLNAGATPVESTIEDQPAGEPEGAADGPIITEESVAAEASHAAPSSELISEAISTPEADEAKPESDAAVDPLAEGKQPAELIAPAPSDTLPTIAEATIPTPQVGAVDEATGARIGRVRRLLGYAARIHLLPVRLVAGILYVLDLPFSKMNPGLKRAVGHVALATCVMAAATWIAGGRLIEWARPAPAELSTSESEESAQEQHPAPKPAESSHGQHSSH